MEINYIPEFIALAECGSSYIAAEQLFVSQSSLLRHVQSIEDEFGMPFFERSRKGFILNKDGQLFLSYARQIASLKNHCYRSLHQDRIQDNVIRIYAEGKVIELMIDFHRLYPQYCIEYYARNRDVQEALNDGEIEIAFLTNLSPRYSDHFQSIHYADEEMLILLYEDHPLARQSSVSMEQLQSEDFIMLVNEIVNNEEFSSRLGYRTHRPRIIASVPSGNDLIRMVREKIGISMIHGRMDTIPSVPGLRVLPLDPPIKYELNIYYRNDTPLSAPAEQFVNYAKRWTSTHKNINQSLIEQSL